MGKKRGRPLKFESPKELEEAINKYFEKCKEEDRPLTMSGLANACGVDRQTILNYSKKEKYFGTIKKARNMCEQYAEEKLFTGGSVAGVIFNLKNNYSWRDKQHIEHLGNKITVKLSDE